MRGGRGRSAGIFRVLLSTAESLNEEGWEGNDFTGVSGICDRDESVIDVSLVQKVQHSLIIFNYSFQVQELQYYWIKRSLRVFVPFRPSDEYRLRPLTSLDRALWKTNDKPGFEAIRVMRLKSSVADIIWGRTTCSISIFRRMDLMDLWRYSANLKEQKGTIIS